MTTKQREKLLKRILPALGILILYFVVGSSFITDKYKTGHDKYTALFQKGLDGSVLTGLQKQQQDLNAELSELKEKETQLTKTIQENSGFLLAHSDDGGSKNEVVGAVSKILQSNNLQVLKEERSDKNNKDTMPKSLRDTEKWLKDMLAEPKNTEKAKPSPEEKKKKAAEPKKVNNKTQETLNIWTIRYTGTYVDSYHALVEIANSNIKALPLSLTMQLLKDKDDTSGKKEWLLTLWL